MMSRSEAPSDTKILTLKVTLAGSDPPIWRRFQLAADMTLGDLHYVLQLVMGWSNSHLHEFRIGRETYATILPPDYDQEPVNDEEEFELREVLKRKGSKLKYIYDFGDGWAHDVRVEEVTEAEPGIRYPRCLDGKRACPPDDCGGIPGYYNMLDVIQDPKHDDHEMYLDWLPENFDPSTFDVARSNEELDRMDAWRRMAEGGRR